MKRPRHEETDWSLSTRCIDSQRLIRWAKKVSPDGTLRLSQLDPSELALLESQAQPALPPPPEESQIEMQTGAGAAFEDEPTEPSIHVPSEAG